MRFQSISSNPIKFQQYISKKYGNIKDDIEDSEKNKTFKQICFPKKFQYQLPQLFVKEFINPNTPYKSLLLFHKIGSGKTCAAIQIAEQWKNERDIYLVVPASLKDNMYKEIMSYCTGNEYISKEEREFINNPKNINTPKYKDLLITIRKRVDESINIISYNKFFNKINSNEIRNSSKALYIFDEIHNVVSENGTFYKLLQQFLLSTPSNARIVIISATPIVDKPIELALTINLLKPKYTLPDSFRKFNNMFINKKPDDQGNILKNVDELKKMLSGYISYYQGAPLKVFPIKEFKIVNCIMKEKQLAEYINTEFHEKITEKSKDGEGIPSNFFIKSRLVSNIAMPLKENELKYNIIGNVSCKIEKILKKIKYSSGTIFIYSTFKEYGGLKTIASALEANGYSDYEQAGPGYKRYALWTGDVDDSKRTEVLNVFNSYENRKGSRIKILLGSPSIKEGVSLLRVRQVHILEPHWNMSRIQQIIGRAIRLCSHKDLEKEKRNVKVFLYIARLQNKYINTIDQDILSIARRKELIINELENILKEVAIDKLLY